MERWVIIASAPLESDRLARIADSLVQTGARLRDVEQAAIRQRALLGLEIEADEEAVERLRRLDPSLVVERTSPSRPSFESWVVTLLAPAIDASLLAVLATALEADGATVERIVRLSEGRLAALELHLRLPRGSDARLLRATLLRLSAAHGFDVALQRESVFRRAKRLVVFDMDSTLIEIEVIDELARLHGVVDRVSAITERAMRGELDFDESLRERVALLRGLDASVLDELAAKLPLTEGAERLVAVLRRLGYRVAVISGGFSVAARALQARLGLHHAHSNVLEIADGKLTGRVVGPIVNGQRKAALLEEIAASEGIGLDQTIAVGDGANDLPMLQKAGLGVAFRAKPRLREAADGAISAHGLDAILHLIGYRESEVLALLR